MSDHVLSQEEVDALFLTMASKNEEGKSPIMSVKYETILNAVENIAEDIDEAGLNDHEAWKKIHEGTGKLIDKVPGELSQIRESLEYCAKGLARIASRDHREPLPMIDGIFEVLDALGKWFRDQPDADELINAAVEQLRVLLEPDEGSVLPEKPSEPPDTRANPVEDMGIGLNDAAALLIEIEPDHPGDLARLRSMLDSLCRKDQTPEICRSIIEQCVERLEPMIQGTDEDAETSLVEIGNLIEKALTEWGKEEQKAEIRDEVLKKKEKRNIKVPEPVIPISEPAQTPPKPEIEKESPFPPIEEDNIDYMPDDAEPELMGAFITESSELITNAEDALLTLETTPDDGEAIGSVFRAFHTIKGTAAFLELTLISEIGHLAESLLSRVREGEIRYAGGYADLSLRTLDMLKELMASVQNALNGTPLHKPEGYDELMGLLRDPEKAGISDKPSEEESPATRIGDILVAQGKVGREDLEDALSESDGESVGEKLIKSRRASPQDVAQALRTQKKMESAPRQMVDSSVRVPTERLDRFIDMVGELVVAHSMVVQDETVSGGKHHDLFKKVNHTSKIVRELQDMSMSMRMIPLKSTFRKMARLVRDLSRKVGKNVSFVTDGDDTEIDRNMVDIINDPLVHMVRNAMDHGLESPDERKRLGKPTNGTIRLSAYHSAGNVVVEISDDGKGLNREAILAKAVERGLIGDQSSISDRDIYNLIFEPGFSTALEVSDVSGRGVGMDVVKKNIENLRGQIEIQSKTGKGSIFKISLPLTLAIIDGMVVRVGEEKYVIPTVSIIRSIKPRPEDISTVLKRGEMVSIQGKLIPLFRLGDLFLIEGAEKDPTKALVVIVENHMQQTGLLIDELVGSQQIVIKTMGETMGNILGISGSAIMPNGRVGLILDVGGLVRLANADSSGEKMREDFL